MSYPVRETFYVQAKPPATTLSIRPKYCDMRTVHDFEGLPL
jgi:hypothetical protein